MEMGIWKKCQLSGMPAVWMLSISMILLSVTYTMIVPFLPIYLLELGVHEKDLPFWSGLVFSTSFFVGAIMAPIWGKIADQHGKKLMIMRAGFLIGLSYLLTGLVQNEYQLIMARVVTGFANGFMPAAMTLVSLSVPKERVGTAMGIFMTCVVLGNALGPLLGGLVENVVGMRPVFYVGACTLFIVTAFVALLIKEPKVDGGEVRATKKTTLWEDIGEVKQNKVLVHILMLYFIVQACQLMLQPIVSIYVGEIKGSMDGAALVAGIILSGGGIAGMISTNVWTAYGQRRGYFRIISYALITTGIALLLQGLPFGLWWFGILQILVGTCVVAIFPSLSSALTLHSDPTMRGRVFGMATTAQQCGSMSGPLFASAVATVWGLHYVFVITGILMNIIGYIVFKAYGNKPNIE